MNKKQNEMVRKATELKSLDELNLSKSTRTYLEKNFSSLDEIVLKGRRIAYYGKGQKMAKWERELSEALDAVGYVRHDFDKVSLITARTIMDCCGYDHNELLNLRDYKLLSYYPLDCNEAYELFEPFSDAQKEFIVKSIDGLFKCSCVKAEIIKLRFGLEDGQPKTYEKVADMLCMTKNSVEKEERKALRIMSRDLRSYYILPPIVLFSGNAAKKIGKLIQEIEELQEKVDDLKRLEERLSDLKSVLRYYAESSFDGSEAARVFLYPPKLPADKNLSVKELDFSTRVLDILLRGGVNTVNDILELGGDIMRLRRCGSKAYEEICEKMHGLGYTDYNPKKK